MFFSMKTIKSIHVFLQNQWNPSMLFSRKPIKSIHAFLKDNKKKQWIASLLLSKKQWNPSMVFSQKQLKSIHPFLPQKCNTSTPQNIFILARSARDPGSLLVLTCDSCYQQKTANRQSRWISDTLAGAGVKWQITCHTWPATLAKKSSVLGCSGPHVVTCHVLVQNKILRLGHVCSWLSIQPFFLGTTLSWPWPRCAFFFIQLNIK